MLSTPQPPDARPPSTGRTARRRHRLGLVALGLLVLVLIVVSPLIGPTPIPPGTVGSILVHQASGGVWPAEACGTATPANRCAIFIEIVWDIRLPALLLALLVGAGLGLSGATLQGIFRNPLADPYLLGLSAGASLGAATLFVLGVGSQAANLVLPLFAFFGALLTGLIILLAARSPRSTTTTLLLTGVALSSFLSAILGTLLLFNPLGNLQVSYWLLGGLFGATWDRVAIVLGGLLVGGTLLAIHGRELNLLQLGPDVAQTLGVDVRRIRLRLLLLASFVTAVAVAFTGIIGFVGLISPHVVRRLFSFDYRIVLAGSVLVGAVFLALAQDVAQVLPLGTEVPVGIPTSFAGFPFFLYLLYRRRRAPEGEAT
ncbi:MAG TPA: iron ABC transporter permease [Thermoplasmata archaeon]|nr:iron ABC transporter permease [Thermoplasmata archaeon]